MKKIHPSITNREFKLLIKPKGLDRRSKITELSEQILKFCKKNKVDFFHLDNANTGLRNVYFYDTPGEEFRLNNIILRVRESRQNVWVDDYAEVTLKCRTHDMNKASQFNPSPQKKIKSRIRFKEEILRGDEIGSHRQIYSNNAILDAVPIDDLFDRSLSSVSKFFPGLAKLSIDKKSPLRIVGGSTNKILEACLPLGNLVFGDGVQAHCDIAIWMKSAGDPIVGELAFSYRVNDENRSPIKAHKRADKFFEKLQIELSQWLEIGSTKTALIYGKPE
ncbi:hypothetical protein A8O14_05025 [Polynucleobacter wuianus]|uniref:CYTH domain-containing protein n=1 Tax=Polynucleobacter wuianus TaxID=1743168 RepID=A0A191UEN3_9BURK|nr:MULTISPECIES: hypothetical protein [Polynucleobacter]ANI99508.1 hypothetical protein A8O14_05025 [Polynucleobacter wuianus]MBU3551868.1 hypothetical protein [Polynucleobacter sp. MWH-Post4-6-1]